MRPIIHKYNRACFLTQTRDGKNVRRPMDYYFLIITIIDIFTLSIMCVFVRYNGILRKRLRLRFISAFLLIILIAILELLTIVVDDGPASLRWLNILANYLGFGLTPAVSIVLSFTLGKNRSQKIMAAAELVYLAVLGISLLFGGVFSVDRNNHYMRGDAFWIYLAAYFMSIVYLLVITARTIRKYQNKSKNCIYLIAVFLSIGSTIQVICPQIHVTWLCVTLLSILYYVYCNIMWQELDGLTGLLNQSSYLNKTASFNQDAILMVFDLDDFKDINDQYGHLKGDQCLVEVADSIRNAYFNDGLCYRIGGDEFFVLLNSDADTEACEKRLQKELEKRRKTLAVLPEVSFGSAVFRVGDDINKVKDMADLQMYQMKAMHKRSKM